MLCTHSRVVVLGPMRFYTTRCETLQLDSSEYQSIPGSADWKRQRGSKRVTVNVGQTPEIIGTYPTLPIMQLDDIQYDILL